MHINSIDHMVLVVKSVERTISFYARVLGMRAEEMCPGRWALHFGTQKFNLQEVDGSVDPLAKHPTPGSGDFCLLTDVPIEDVTAHLAEQGIEIFAGPARRIGAVGPLESVYFYDPDENMVEISNQLGPAVA
jgi:catechol 2,3-dioxygenase-like lactoylglutathione lyase family enzyme